MRYSLTIREDDRLELDSILDDADGNEHAAYLLCRVVRVREDPWTGSGARRLLVREVLPVDDVISNSRTHVTWSTDSFVRLVGRCEREGLSIFIAHNHPDGVDDFSEADDQSEGRLFPYALDKLGDGAVAGSILLRADRSLIGRVWIDSPLRWERLSIATIGESWRFETTNAHPNPRETLQRQSIALGEQFNRVMSGLRIGIVGCGATGSAAAMLLARLGTGHLLLLDADIVDVTNLNRLHGASQSDADAGRKKVEVLRDAIAGLALGCKVRTSAHFVEELEVRDGLRSCDLIFSCTDDHLGRAVLNRLAYFYLIPVIDIGVSIHPHKTRTGFSHADGRVTVLQPGASCLFCRQVLSPARIQADGIRRTDPETYERLKAEGYIIGAGNPSPAVITFTTEIASIAVNELIQRLTEFRGKGGQANQRYRHFLESDESTTGDETRQNCRVCGSKKRWARGDHEPFLEMTL